MFPKTDTISEIVSNTVKTVFKRRLVDRVLRLWTEIAQGGQFPRREQIEPSVLGVDWANCLMIAVQSPVERSYFAEVGENLLFAHCPNDSLAGVLLAHLPLVRAQPSLGEGARLLGYRKDGGGSGSGPRNWSGC